MNEDWCSDCCTRHPATHPCPGPTDASGPERHGWRVTVQTSKGKESYGVMVAPALQRWRSTIVTYPATPWPIPGGGGTMRFLADSPQEAERQAVDYIRGHIERSGFTVKERSGPIVAPGPVPTAAEGAGSRVVSEPAGNRRLCAFGAAFGHNAETRRGQVANVSERGLFVATDNPMKAGSVVRLRLETLAQSIPLRGMVVWSRARDEAGRLQGMGVRLFKPPAAYLNLIRSLP